MVPEAVVPEGLAVEGRDVVLAMEGRDVVLVVDGRAVVLDGGAVEAARWSAGASGRRVPSPG